MTKPIRLGDLLVRAGLISESVLRRALAEQQTSGDKLGVVLVRMGLLTEDMLVRALAHQLEIPLADLSSVSVPTNVLQKIGRTFCEQNGVLPLSCSQDRSVLYVAISDPSDPGLLDEITGIAEMRVEPRIASESDIVSRVRQIFEQAMGAQTQSAPRVVTAIQRPEGDEIEHLRRLAERQEKLLRSMFALLVERGVLGADDMGSLM